MLIRTTSQRRGLAALLPFISVLTLAACGGGGGGGGGGSSNQAPNAAFGATEGAGGPPATVYFSGADSTDSDGSIASYAWSFGNDTTGAGQVTSTSYAADGTYTVTLTVTDNDGASDSVSRDITVGGSRHDVSGTVSVPSGTVTDSDTADPNAGSTSNDSASSAQQIAAPVVVGGFVHASNDEYDSYRVSLSAGDAVNLSIGDFDSSAPASVDLDLALFTTDDPPTLIEESVATDTAVESVSAPSDGDYYVVVRGYAGQSNYVMDVARGSLASHHSYNVSANFIPGELIVRFKDDAQAPAAAGTPGALATQMGMQHKAGDFGRPMLMSLGDHLQTIRAFDALGVAEQPGEAPPGFNLSAQARRKLATVQAAKALSTREDVAGVALNHIHRPQLQPDDTYYQYQWHYPQISLPQAWEQTQGAGVIVAVADTGIFAHPDLAGQTTGTGYDFISSADRALDGDGIDPDPTDPGDQALPDGSSSFHGTHVSGTIAAASNNTSGVAGVAWNAQIMPIRVLGEGGGTTYDILQGLRYAVGLSNDSGVILPESDRADVINLSLGGPGSSSDIAAEFQTVRNGPDGDPDTADDVLLIAAAGNAGSTTPQYPASYEAVVSVSATDIQNNLAPYSSYGQYVALAAPGGDVSKDLNGDTYADGVLSTAADDSGGSPSATFSFQNGTSMASPHVAGVAALMKAVNNAMLPSEFEAALAQGSLTDDINGDGTTRNDQFGYGLINAAKAVDWAANGTLSPLVAASPTRLDFGAGTGTDTETFTVSNATGADSDLGTVTVSHTNPGWLEVTASSVDANGAGEYTATVDRQGLDDGSYSATITVTTENGGDTELDVRMRVGSAITAADAGYLYVLLVDPETGLSAAQSSSAGTDGTYSFDFIGVPQGQYLLIAGSDMDDDLFVCDAGEACGAYPSISDITPITVDRNRTGMDFTSQYRLNLNSTASAFSRQGEGGYDRRQAELEP